MMNYSKWSPIFGIIGVIFAINIFVFSLENVYGNIKQLLSFSILLLINSFLLIRIYKIKAEMILGYLGIILVVPNIVLFFFLPGVVIPMPGIMNISLGIISFIIFLVVSFLLIYRTME